MNYIAAALSLVVLVVGVGIADAGSAAEDMGGSAWAWIGMTLALVGLLGFVGFLIRGVL